MEKWIACLVVLVAVGALTSSVSATPTTVELWADDPGNALGDTLIAPVWGDTNYGTDITLDQYPIGSAYYSFILNRWNISSIPPGQYIVNATVFINQYPPYLVNGQVDMLCPKLLYENYTWNTNTVTWNNGAPAANQILQTNTSACRNYTNADPGIAYYGTNITSIVQYYYSRGSENVSFAFIAYNVNGSYDSLMRFFSQDYVAYSQYLVIIYDSAAAVGVSSTSPADNSVYVNQTSVNFSATLTNTSDTKFDRLQLWANTSGTWQKVNETSSPNYGLQGALTTLSYKFPDVGTYLWSFYANLSNGTGYWSQGGNRTIIVSKYGNSVWQDSPASDTYVSSGNATLSCNASTDGLTTLANTTYLAWNYSGTRIYDVFPSYSYNSLGSSFKLSSTVTSVLPGVNRWSNPTRLTADDGSYATCANATSGYRTCYTANSTGFSMGVPAKATINGITVFVKRYASAATTNFCNDSSVKLMKAGVVVGSNYASSSKYPSGSGAVANATYGSGVDLWGTTWSASEVNDALFGLAFQPGTNRTSSTTTCSVDAVWVRVNYTQALTGYNDSVSVSGVFNQSSVNVSFSAYPQQTFNWSCQASKSDGSLLGASSNWSLSYGSPSVTVLAQLKSPVNNSQWASSNTVTFTYNVSGMGDIQRCILNLKTNGSNDSYLDFALSAQKLPAQSDNVWSFSNGTHTWGIIGAIGDMETDMIWRMNEQSQATANSTVKPYLTDREMCASVNSSLVVCAGGANTTSNEIPNIYWFNPVANTTTLKADKLPYGIWGGQAASNVTDVFFMGGLNASGLYEKKIYDYKLATGVVTNTGNTLPGHGATRYSPSFDFGGYYYWAGGLNGSSANTNDISHEVYRFNKSSGAVDVVANFYEGRYGMVGFWTGTYWYFGAGKPIGGGTSNWSVSWFRFNPANSELINVTGASSALGMATSGNAWYGNARRGYLMGGSTWDYDTTDNITIAYPYSLVQVENATGVTKDVDQTFTYSLPNSGEFQYRWFVNCSSTMGVSSVTPEWWFNVSVSGAFQCGFSDPGDWVYSSAGECVVTDSYSKTSGDLLVNGGGTLVFDNSILRMSSGSRAVVYSGKIEQRNGGKVCGSGCG